MSVSSYIPMAISPVSGALPLAAISAPLICPRPIKPMSLSNFLQPQISIMPAQSPVSLRPIITPKKPVARSVVTPPRESPLELPARIKSDNGKRCWELFKSIGKGGCGEVYLAKECNTSQPTPYVAVKIIKVVYYTRNTNIGSQTIPI